MVDMAPMPATAYEWLGDIATFRVGAGHGLEDGARLIRDVIAQARDAGVGKLLVDITAIETGPPGVGERYWVMSEWASVGRGAVRLALLIRPEFIDPQHFGTAVARNRGLAFRAFVDEARARLWLAGGIGTDASQDPSSS